jgi:class 3 adenylate cyclase/tetratricopeptide (TPR) repeat protein
MICGSCGTTNEAGRKFCKECASPLAVACARCGTPNAPDAKFCGECAAPLSGGTTATPPAPRVAERRLVSVLFADLVGFTPYSEGKDPEEVREMLSAWFEQVTEIVRRYGGTVEKFIGDAVMAVWGTPAAHEDDAERAVRAALDIVDAVPEGLQGRGGVLTGEAAVTLGAGNEGLVTGDMVNTASRLQSVAEPGTVLVGEATYRAASRAIAFEEAGAHELKGKAAPVPAWRALRIVGDVGGRNASEAMEPPFVGRQEELRLIKDLFHATERDRRVRLVSVMGPGGIGKSRLAREFGKYVDGLADDVYYHTGRSPAYGEGVTHWALGEMVRTRCALLEADDEATTRAKVGRAVAQWISDPDERGWVQAALLTLLGVATEIPSQELFAAWRTFFERIAEAGTVVMVFEDFQFADSGLLDFVDHLLEWSRGYPIYVLALTRPELLEKRPDWGAAKRNFASLSLEPLADGAMRELLAGLVPGLPADSVRAIVQRADGIPLYAVEMVRMLVADGRLREEAGAYVPDGELKELAVPSTLVALIGARLDALDPGDRSLLQDAAVLGLSFASAALAVVSGVAHADLEARLADLVRRELFTREADPRSPERGQYVFVQALIREVAYSTLSKRDRKARHLACARYFESLETDELAGALASHYLAAHANASDPAEADALAAQARIALRGAADRAAALGAFDQVVAFLEQALTVTSDPAQEAELLEQAGRAADIAGRYAAADSLLQRAVELRKGLGDRRGAARATALLGEAMLDGFRLEAAKDLLEAAAEEYSDLGQDEQLAEIQIMLARAHTRDEQEGSVARAAQLAERVLEFAERKQMLSVLATALITRGTAIGSLGRKREGLALINAGGELAREEGLQRQQLGALLLGGLLLMDLDYTAAFEAFREGLGLARRYGRRSMLLTFVGNMGYSAFLTGEWETALQELERVLEEELDPRDRLFLRSNALVVRAARGEDIRSGIEELQSLGRGMSDVSFWESHVHDPTGNAALAAGRLQEARDAWLAVARNAPEFAAEFRYRAARPAIWMGDLEGARSDLEVLVATELHGRVMDARRMTIEAALLAAERQQDALPRYRDALRAWHDLRQPWDEALTVIDMVTLLDPSLPEVRRAADTAREFFARVGAMPFVERLDSALARPSPSRAAGVTTTAVEANTAEERV